MRWVISLLIFLVPFVAQVGVGADAYWNDCGAASVSMLVEYYTGLTLCPDELMAEIGRDRYLTAIDLANLMQEYGLVVQWGEGVPRIVLVGGNHWVVYLGDGVYHDPLRGPYQEGYLGDGLYVEEVVNSELGLLCR